VPSFISALNSVLFHNMSIAFQAAHTLVPSPWCSTIHLGNTLYPCKKAALQPKWRPYREEKDAWQKESELSHPTRPSSVYALLPPLPCFTPTTQGTLQTHYPIGNGYLALMYCSSVVISSRFILKTLVGKSCVWWKAVTASKMFFQTLGKRW